MNVKKQWVAINTHELGHHAQFAYGGGYEVYTTRDAEPMSGSLKEIYKKTDDQPTRTIRREKFAWNVAKDFYSKKGEKFKGATKLVENWAFGTYVGTTPKSMQGPKPKFVFDASKQLIVTRKRAKGSMWGK